MIVLSKKQAQELDDERKCPKCGKFPCACASETQNDVCPVCGKQPCVCDGGDKKPQVCSKCGQNPCQCGGEVGKKHFFGTIQCRCLPLLYCPMLILVTLNACFSR